VSALRVGDRVLLLASGEQGTVEEILYETAGYFVHGYRVRLDARHALARDAISVTARPHELRRLPREADDG
jgi:ABC-type proline/glycine betaine transport system ATPase subunit